MRANYIVITSDKLMSSFMQAADMFDKSKFIVSICEMTVDFTMKKPSLKKAGTCMETLKAGLEKHGKVPILIHLTSVESDNVIIGNNKVEPFVDMSVRTISDGKKWSLMRDILLKLGLDVKTNEHMFITEAKIKN